jgi:hypothetical protein
VKSIALARHFHFGITKFGMKAHVANHFDVPFEEYFDINVFKKFLKQHGICYSDSQYPILHWDRYLAHNTDLRQVKEGLSRTIERYSTSRSYSISIGGELFFTTSIDPLFSLKVASLGLVPSPPLLKECNEIKKRLGIYNGVHLRIESDWTGRSHEVHKTPEFARKDTIESFVKAALGSSMWNKSLPVYVGSGVSCKDADVSKALSQVSTSIHCAPPKTDLTYAKAIVDSCVLRGAHSMAAQKGSSFSFFTTAFRCVDSSLRGSQATLVATKSFYYSGTWDLDRTPCWGVDCGCLDIHTKKGTRMDY